MQLCLKTDIFLVTLICTPLGNTSLREFISCISAQSTGVPQYWSKVEKSLVYVSLFFKNTMIRLDVST